jgi:hypothetical protein
VKYYIATGLENATAHNELRDAMAARGHVLTYDWTTHGNVGHLGQAAIAEVAKGEAYGVRRATVVIVLLPGGRGTHVELGMALAWGRMVILCSNEPIEANPATCAFYWHPHVECMAVDIPGIVWRAEALCGAARMVSP